MVRPVVTSYGFAKAAGRRIVERPLICRQERSHSGQGVRGKRFLPARLAGHIMDDEASVFPKMKHLVQLFFRNVMLLHPLVHRWRVLTVGNFIIIDFPWLFPSG